MTGDSQTAEDLTQEACLKAYRAFGSYTEGTNYQAWIFRIMSNLCTDYLRRKSRAPFVDWAD
jgi:RNA polymerase sigma-70 factor (ECF subfamily)